MVLSGLRLRLRPDQWDRLESDRLRAQTETGAVRVRWNLGVYSHVQKLIIYLSR